MARGKKQAIPPPAPAPPSPPPPSTPPLLFRSPSVASTTTAEAGNSMQVLQIARYYALRAGILLGLWGVQRLVVSVSRRVKGKAQKRQQPVAATDGFKILLKPLEEYKAANPVWLTRILAMDDAALAADPTWQCPLLKDFEEGLQDGKLTIAFGEPCRRQLFCLEQDAVYLQHGSYGATFRLAQEVQRWYQQLQENHPVRWVETISLKGLLSAEGVVARMLHCNPRDVVSCVNATSGMQAVINGFKLGQGDLVLILTITYPALRSAVARMTADAGAGMIVVEVTLEHMQHPQLLLGAVQAALDAGRGRVRLAVLDHIVSFPPIVLPVQQLAALCRKAGAKVLVDGAHALGALADINVPALGVHYYTSNLHKWCCSPKGCAVLWVAPSEQSYVRPLLASHGYGLGFRGDWLCQGTRELSGWLAVPAALAVMRALGTDRVIQHNHSLVEEAALMLQRRWGTGPILSGNGVLGSTGIDGGATGLGTSSSSSSGGAGSSGGGSSKGAGCPMAAVPLPALRGYGTSPEEALKVHDELLAKHRVEVPVSPGLGRLWVRVSAQMYNELSDYAVLAEAVAGMMVGAEGAGKAVKV